MSSSSVILYSDFNVIPIVNFWNFPIIHKYYWKFHNFLESKNLNSLKSNVFLIGKEDLEDKKVVTNVSLVHKRLTEDEILAQAWIFFLSSYETSATTLSFCLYELTLNHECQQTLCVEICSAIDSNGEITYETLLKLPYLDSVISETLRLYLPVGVSLLVIFEVFKYSV